MNRIFAWCLGVAVYSLLLAAVAYVGYDHCFGEKINWSNSKEVNKWEVNKGE
ncbi:MAG: hypothetical protein KAQ85_01650 [Thermodesulfovibrionia bacterium]|nr:hypothetical protein [Thermodesulfovibrionia bacterium]